MAPKNINKLKQIPESKIIEKYLELKAVSKTARFFGVQDKNIKEILVRNNIQIQFGFISETDRAKIIELYYQNVPIKTIAENLSLTKAIIKTSLKKWGIKPIGYKRTELASRLNISEDEIVAKFDELGTVAATARYFNSSVTTLRKILKGHRNTNWQEDVRKLVISKEEEIKELYHQGYSGKEIGKKIGVCYDIIFKYLKKFGVEIKVNHGFNTSIERTVKSLLEELNIEYKFQFHLQNGPTKKDRRIYDFYIPAHNLIIEVNGDYWHSNPKTLKKLNNTQKKIRIRDKEKKKLAKDRGLKIMYIWELDIEKNLSKVKRRLQKFAP